MEHELSKELGKFNRIPIPVLNFFLTLERDILLKKGEHKVSKELGKSKRIQNNFFLTL